MIMKYSDEVNALFDKIKPYIDYTKFPPTLRPDTPQNIRDDREKMHKLMDKERGAICERFGIPV